jgi:protein-tyrosine-phosphatase/ADP-ribose pyrophosphatase YjhB (NUDIX family)
MKSVLFLCTGNYYRSRFAEELFNQRATDAHSDWSALSRALAIERGINNVGPISPVALRALEERGLVARASNRYPQQCAIADLEAADCIVALNEPEHRPLMLERFARWATRTEYWKIDDVEYLRPSVALAMIDRQVDVLLDRLHHKLSDARSAILASFRNADQTAKAAMFTGSSASTPRPLTDDEFAHVVRNAPLVAVDIIIKDPEDRVLVGRRVNEPAKGHYFVPGGAIRKNEMIRSAFARILKAETGLHASIDQAKFLGVFEHFYDANRFQDHDYGTHYVVLAYELTLTEQPSVKLDSQHSDIRWLSAVEILSAPDVHPNTRAYFQHLTQSDSGYDRD